MALARDVLLLFLLACQFNYSYQESSWWISDNELFTSNGQEATIYNTITEHTTDATVADALLDTDNLLSFSHDLKYTAEFIKNQENFAVIIHDNFQNTNYTVGLPNRTELHSFKWSRGSAFLFSDGYETYYVSSPEQQPIVIPRRENIPSENEDSEVLLKKPRGVILDSSIEEKEGKKLFSPRGTFIAFWSSTSNSTGVMTLKLYDRSEPFDYESKISSRQPGEYIQTNYSIFIWSVQNNRTTKMDIKLKDYSELYSLLGMSWVELHGKEVLIVTFENRWGNKTTIMICSYETTTCSLIYEQKYEAHQWTEWEYANIVYSNSSFFVILPTAKMNNYWQHITQIEISTDFGFKYLTQIPSGEYDIRKIVEYREEEKIIIFEAQAPEPWNRHIYAAPAKDGSILLEDVCLTCEYSDCTYQQKALINPWGNISISVWCKGPSPTSHLLFLYDEEFHNTGSIEISLPNKNLMKQMISWKIETFQLSSGYEAIVKIYEGNPNKTSVPVTLKVYGGPDDNEVTDLFEKPKDYEEAVVHIDVRGAGGRGWNYRSAIYGGLLTVEVDDTIEAMRLVLEKYPRLDKNRVGVTGFSYGGSLTLALVEKAPPSFFKCAIAGAPVTNFYRYGAWYSERYMGDTPYSNYTDLTLDVNAFKSTELLLIHGLADDNVYFQHSAILIEALQQADIPFQLMVYPNQDHGIGGKVGDHYEHLQESFFTKCYEKE